MVLVGTTFTVLAYALLAVAVIVGVVALAVIADFVVTNRKQRLAASTGDLAEGVVVVRHEVTYVSPLLFGFRPVSIESWVTEIRAASFTVAYEIFHEDAAGERTVYLRAKTVLTPYVFSTERPRRITDTERASLAGFLELEERSPRPAPHAPRPANA